MEEGVSDTDPTSAGRHHIDRWQAAQRSVERARSSLNREEVELANATAALIKWLTPDDPRFGEKFSVWYGDSLIQVEVTALTPLDGKVTVRLRGRSLDGA